MSLLMDALRKAEEAKRKVTQDQVPEALNASEETVPAETQSNETPSADSVESPLSILPMEPKEVALETTFQPETAEIAPNSETSAKNNATEDSNRQAASALFQAKRPTQQTNRSKLLALVALLIFVPFAGIFIWLYVDSSSSNFPTPPLNSLANNQQRFLGDAPPATQNQTAAMLSVPDEQSVSDTKPAVIVSNQVPQQNQPVPLINVATKPTAPTLASQNTIITPQSKSSELRLTRTNSTEQVDPQLLSAFDNYQNGKLSQAQDQYQAVLRQQSNNRDALLGLASVYLKNGETSSAQAMYSRILKLNPRDPLASAGLIESSQTADPLRQETALKSLRTQHPDIAPLAFALGNLYASQNRWSEAQNEYFNALRIAKANDNGAISPDYAFNLAIGLERLNQLKPAYRYYQDALELSRHSPPGFDLELLQSRLTYLEKTLQ